MDKNVVNKNSLKSSQEKNFKKLVLTHIPNIEGYLSVIWPKKATISYGKKPNSQVYFINDEPTFVQKSEGPIVPHLRLLHKYPNLLPTCQVDKGAIKFVLSGANIMAPGLTSKGGIPPSTELRKKSGVTILAEGKENAMAIGYMTISGEEVIPGATGIAIELITYLGDETWNIR